jgi:hypothetical protein
LSGSLNTAADAADAAAEKAAEKAAFIDSKKLTNTAAFVWKQEASASRTSQESAFL